MTPTKYVVTMNPQMQCTLEAFEENRELYLDRGDTYEVFDAPSRTVRTRALTR